MNGNQMWFLRRARVHSTSPKSRGRARPRLRARPAVLFLEDRRLMTMMIMVTSQADSGQGTLRAAVAAANAATKPVEIDFQLQGAAAITLTSGQLELKNTAVPITIKGPGAALLAVDGDQKSRVFQIDPNVMASISGLTIRNGFAAFGFDMTDSGAGLLNEGTATLTGVVISGNVSQNHSGGLSNINGNLTLSDCSVTGNSAQEGSALENMYGGEVTLIGTTVSGNVADTNTLDNYASAQSGNGITVIDCLISGNTSSSSYGYVLRNDGDFTIVGSAVKDNTSGGLWNAGGTMALTDSTVSGNTGNGGGVASSNYGTLTMSGCIVSGNTAAATYSTGGGISILGGAATLTDCTISDNHAQYGAGVASLSGTTTLTGCTISGNSALSQGGGLIIIGTATMTNCTVSRNSATQGGGVFVQDGDVAMVACSFSGNTASVGAGIYNYFRDSTSSTVVLTDTIVAGDTTLGGQASEIGGADPDEITGSYNLIGTGGSGGLTADNHNLLNIADPGLTPLGDYGGPTETIALQRNSPAIGAGTAVAGVTTDQRGFPLDNPPDIGAFQSQTGPLVVDTAIDGIGSSLGQLSLRQAVNLANVLDGGDAITFEKSVFKKAKTITLIDGPLEISNTTGPISITGTAAKRLTISGGDTSGVFTVDVGSSAILSNLTIAGGVTAGNGGGLLNQGTTTLANVVVAGNVASGDGGGLFNSGSLFASNLAVADNSATDGGGLDNAGTAVIVASSIDSNVVSSDGGGIFNTGALALSLSDLSANSAALDGGGLFNEGTAALVFCTVDDNAASAGGGVYADPSGQPVVLIGTEFNRNKGGNVFGRVIQL